MKRNKILSFTVAVSVAVILAGCNESQISEYESRTDWLNAKVYTSPLREFVGKAFFESIPYERGLQLFKDGKYSGFVDIDGIVYLPVEGQSTDECGGLVVGICHEGQRVFNEDRILIGRCTIDNIDREANYAIAGWSCGSRI